MRFAWRWEGARPEVTVCRAPEREAWRTERPVVRGCVMVTLETERAWGGGGEVR